MSGEHFEVNVFFQWGYFEMIVFLLVVFLLFWGKCLETRFGWRIVDPKYSLLTGTGLDGAHAVPQGRRRKKMRMKQRRRTQAS